MFMPAGDDENIAAFNRECLPVHNMYSGSTQNDNQFVEPVNMARELQLRVADVNLKRQSFIFEIILFPEFFYHGVIVLKNVRIVKVTPKGLW
jgi:hypothetical protein